MNYRTALNISDGFRLSADRVMQAFGTTTQELERALMANAAMLPVAVTNLSFAVEIALKTLLSLDDGVVSLKGAARHDLSKLFGLLDEERQEALSRAFDDLLKQPGAKNRGTRIVKGPWGGEVDEERVREEAKPNVSSSLSEALDTARSNFVDWRFVYERSDEQRYYTFEIDNLVRVHTVIRDEVARLLED